MTRSINQARAEAIKRLKRLFIKDYHAWKPNYAEECRQETANLFRVDSEVDLAEIVDVVVQPEKDEEL